MILEFRAELAQLRVDAEEAPDTDYRTGYLAALEDVEELADMLLDEEE